MSEEEEKGMKKPPIRGRLHEGIRWLRRQDALYLGMLSLIVGVLAGYGALFLRLGIEEVSQLWTGERTWSQAVGAIPWYLYIIAPVTGGLLVGWVNTNLIPKGQARVIPGVIEALSERGGRISGKKMIGEFAGNVIAVGSGASMGREAPTVALGAALASLLGQKLGLNEKRMRTLLGCGVAAGIAASFNAPIAGVLFALEVILADYAVATFTPIVLSSVIATVITRSELGNYPGFAIPKFELVSGWEIPAYIGLGVFCGLIAAFIIKLLPKVRAQFEKRVKNSLLRPAVAGLILGCVAIFLPEIMSIGYGTVSSILLEQILSDSLGWTIPLTLFLAILLVGKVATSIICSAGSFGGGMIGPSLFIGATAGALYGYIAHGFFPEYSETFGAYALVGCGALLAATVQAPMSTILMIFELSGDYHIMVPLMAACVVAALVKRAFGPESVITESLEAKGIETGWGLERSWMRAVPIRRIPWRAIPAVSEHARLEELKRVFISLGKGCVQVTDDDGLMVGIVTFEDLKEWLLDPTLDHIVVAAEVANRHVQTVSEKGSLLDVIRVMDREEFEQMPVVAADEPRRVLGILSRNAVFATYHKLIVKHGEASDHTHV
ncbi:MAG: chloride channel protein [Mariprofundaceae bacterium]|nr:chloride channel protein [Mariprofundaceae bacterium]